MCIEGRPTEQMKYLIKFLPFLSNARSRPRRVSQFSACNTLTETYTRHVRAIPTGCCVSLHVNKCTPLQTVTVHLASETELRTLQKMNCVGEQRTPVSQRFLPGHEEQLAPSASLPPAFGPRVTTSVILILRFHRWKMSGCTILVL